VRKVIQPRGVLGQFKLDGISGHRSFLRAATRGDNKLRSPSRENEAGASLGRRRLDADVLIPARSYRDVDHRAVAAEAA